MPASRETSRKLRLAKLRSALSWLKAASISVRRVRSFCCALTPITFIRIVFFFLVVRPISFHYTKIFIGPSHRNSSIKWV